jgi:quinoprotein glucose dehydrogenase
MKTFGSRHAIVAVLALAALLVAILIASNMAGSGGPGGMRDTWSKFRQKLVRQGFEGVWDAIVDRLKGTDIAAGPAVKYSLLEKETYPPVEDPAQREALPQYRTIAGLDVQQHPAAREAQARYDSWHRSHGDDASSKYSALDQINTGNVARLEVAWTHATGSELGDPAKSGLTVETNPVIAHGRMFTTSIDGYLIALDAARGSEIWRLKLPAPVARRGMVWEPHADLAKSRLFVPAGDGVYAVDPARGKVITDFGNQGQVGDQLALIPPTIVNGKLIAAFVSSAIEAYDLRTGALLWSRSVFDRADKRGTDLYGGVPWGGMSSDPARSAVYVSTGNPRPELVGISRPGANRHSCSVLAVNADTGAILWSTQEVTHDLWDLDVPSPPVLTTITRDGKRIDVVATVTKSGNTLLLDRDFGKPVFEYRLRRAPVSTIPGEHTAPYQPALELPEPFSKQVFDPADVTDLTHAADRVIRRKIEGARTGFFEPPVLGGKIVLYGLHGGAEWPGAAVDPGKGVLYVPSNQVPWLIRAGYVDANATREAAATVPGDALYQGACAECHKPNRAGSYETEFSGDGYVPALTGITFLRDRATLTSLETFRTRHADVRMGREPTASELAALFDYFTDLDRTSDRQRSFSVRAFWQLLLDDRGYPGSKPPWGLLTAIDLNTGRKIWQIPFGEYDKLQRGGRSVKGQPNFGGVIATAGGLLFATGTVDNKVRAFDASDGRELWSYQLPAAGSAPPVTYSIDGTQYVAVVATGGLYHGFSGRSDKLVAFRLPAQAQAR